MERNTQKKVAVESVTIRDGFVIANTIVMFDEKKGHFVGSTFSFKLKHHPQLDHLVPLIEEAVLAEIKAIGVIEGKPIEAKVPAEA